MKRAVYIAIEFDMDEKKMSLECTRGKMKAQEGYTQIFEVYGCADCSGFEHKARFLYKYNAEKMLKETRS